MQEKPRQPEFEDRVFSDENGNKYQGVMVHNAADYDLEQGYLSTYYSFKDGKIDGERAIEYPDGLEETWKDGKFVRVRALPLAQREEAVL